MRVVAGCMLHVYVACCMCMLHAACLCCMSMLHAACLCCMLHVACVLSPASLRSRASGCTLRVVRFIQHVSPASCCRFYASCDNIMLLCCMCSACSAVGLFSAVDWRQCRASLRHVRSQGDYFYVLESGRASAFVKGVDGRVCLETTHTGCTHRHWAAHAGSAACCMPVMSSSLTGLYSPVPFPALPGTAPDQFPKRTLSGVFGALSSPENP